MSRKLQISDPCNEDLEVIFSWLVRRSMRGAFSWYLAFKDAVREVHLAPDRFAFAAESRRLRRDLRQAIFKTRRGRPYRIVFEFDDDEVRVMRLRGPGQDLLRRRDLPGD